MPFPKPTLVSGASASARARARGNSTAGESTGEPPAPDSVVSSPDAARASRADARLVGLMQEGDPHAVELLYHRHAGAALGLARRILGDAALAEDVTREALVSMWRSCREYRPERGSVRTWVLGITHELASDALRGGSPRTRLDAAETASPARPADDERIEVDARCRDEARVARRTVEALPREQRQAIELAYFAGLTQTEIATELNVPLDAVKGRLHLGLQELLRALGPGEVVA